jgi:hypothetical protein
MRTLLRAGERVTEQLTLDLAEACSRLADRLRDPRQRPTGGAERLLVALARRGLAERDVRAAALLALALDEAAPRGASS